MLKNGFIVTSEAWDPAYASSPPTLYSGVAFRTPWPLEWVIEDGATLQNRLHAELGHLIHREYPGNPESQSPSFELAVVTNLDFIARYLKACSELGIAARSFLVGTERTRPLLTNADAERAMRYAQFLGFDYCNSDFSYSALADDSNAPELADLMGQRNEHGLMPTLAIARLYVDARRRLTQSQAGQFEVGDDFEIAETHELNSSRMHFSAV